MDFFVGATAAGTGDGSSIANRGVFTSMRTAVARAAGLTAAADGTWPRNALESGRVLFLPGTYNFKDAFTSIQTLVPDGLTLEICPCDSSGKPLARGTRLVLTGDRNWRGTQDPSPNTGGEKGSTAFSLAGGSGGYKIHGFHLKNCAYGIATASLGSVTKAQFYDNEFTNVQIGYAARTDGTFTNCTFDHRIHNSDGTYSFVETFHGYSKAMGSFGTDSSSTTQGSCNNTVQGMVGYGGQTGDGFLNGWVLLGNVNNTANKNNVFEDCAATALVSPTAKPASGSWYGSQGDGFANEEYDTGNVYNRCGVRASRDANGNIILGTGAGDGGFDIKGEGTVINDGFAEDCKRSVRKHQDDHTTGGGTLTVNGFTSVSPWKHGYDSSGESAHIETEGSTIRATGFVGTDPGGIASLDLLAQDQGGHSGNIYVTGSFTSPGLVNKPRSKDENGVIVYSVTGSASAPTPDPTLPKPTNVTATQDATTGRSVVKWTPPAGCSSVQVFERTNTPNNPLGTFTPDVTTRTGAVLTAGKSYTFSVIAVYPTGISAEVAATPATLIGRAASTGTPTSSAAPLPTITITSPVTGATLSGSIPLTATATNATQVSYYCNNVLIGQGTSGASWDSTTVPDGAYSLTAVATNVDGVQVTSYAQVTVANTVVPPSTIPVAPTNGYPQGLLVYDRSARDWVPFIGGVGDDNGGTASNLLIQSQQAGAAYTFALSDGGTAVDFLSGSAVTVTVPASASVNFPVGTSLILRQYGSGQVTITPGSTSVLLRSRGNALRTAGQYSEVVLTNRAVDEWIISGDVTV